METVLVRRSGFSYRLPYTQFLLRYKMLSRHTWPHWPRGSSSSTPIEATVHLIRSIPVPTAEFNFGRTKLFIRSPRTVCKLSGTIHKIIYCLKMLKYYGILINIMLLS